MQMIKKRGGVELGRDLKPQITCTMPELMAGLRSKLQTTLLSFFFSCTIVPCCFTSVIILWVLLMSEHIVNLCAYDQVNFLNKMNFFHKFRNSCAIYMCCMPCVCVNICKECMCACMDICLQSTKELATQLHQGFFPKINMNPTFQIIACHSFTNQKLVQPTFGRCRTKE